MRLIDADPVIAFIDRGRHNNPKVKSWSDEDVESLIESRPTIDAVPVVRCKDCRWHEQEQPGMVYCPATVGGWVENEWFCKGGERDDDDKR